MCEVNDIKCLSPECEFARRLLEPLENQRDILCELRLRYRETKYDIKHGRGCVCTGQEYMYFAKWTSVRSLGPQQKPSLTYNTFQGARGETGTGNLAQRPPVYITLRQCAYARRLPFDSPAYLEYMSYRCRLRVHRPYVTYLLWIVRRATQQ